MSKLLQSIDKLLHVKNYHIEQLKQKIGLVQQQIDARYGAIDSNIRYINTERLIATVNVNGAATLDAFIAKKHFDNSVYTQEIQELKKTQAEIEEQLLDVYMDVKRFEKVKEKEKVKIIDAEKCRETIDLDEIATQRHFFLNYLKHI
jgi:flagellar export protein FliJ